MTIEDREEKNMNYDKRWLEYKVADIIQSNFDAEDMQRLNGTQIIRDLQSAVSKLVEEEPQKGGIQEDAIWFDAMADSLGVIIMDKPVIPKAVARAIQEAKREKRNIKGLLEDKGFNIVGNPLRNWCFSVDGRLNYKTLTIAWFYGYELEEDPQWVVKHPNTESWFVHFKGDGVSGVYGLREQAYKMNTVEKANAIATLVGGTVELW